MASEIRVDKINSLSGVGTVTLSPTGVDIAGITTAATLRATTGIVTSLTAGSLTSLGAVSGTTGTFSGAVSGTTGTFSAAVSGTTGTFSGAVSGTTGTFTGDVDIADKIVHTGDTDTAIRFSGADTITAETAGSARLTINSSGKIGLNQSGPYAELDITSSVEDTTTGALSAHGIRLGAVGATDEQVIPITAGFKSQQDRARAGIGFISKPQSSVEGYAGAIGFYTRNAADASVLKTTDEKMRLDGNGLGIGTAASGGRLHVHDESVNTYLKVTNNNGTRAFLGCESGEAVIYAQDDSGGNAELAFHTGGTEQFKMTTAGIAFPSGKGIDFSATSDASGQTSELFDDYEEGSWTPNIRNEGTTANWNSQTGKYVKIGQQVTVWWNADGGSDPRSGGSSSSLIMTGLPFSQSMFSNPILGHVGANKSSGTGLYSTSGLILSPFGQGGDQVRFGCGGQAINFSISYVAGCLTYTAAS